MSLAELQAARARRTSSAAYARLPVEFVRGEGARLWDDEGNEYLDFLTGLGVNSLGHCHPAVVEAIREQARRADPRRQPLLHRAGDAAGRSGWPSRSLGGKVLLRQLRRRGQRGGAEAARARPSRGGDIVSVHRAFHGRTYGALSATPQESKQAPFAPLVPGFVAVEPTAEAIAAAVDDGTAAVLLEPVQGESGVYELVRRAAAQAARAACDAHGAALIFDEIQCGLGRTGTLWAYEHSGVVPDAMTIAKALGGGLPIGALVTGPRLADVLAAGRSRLDVRRRPGACAAGAGRARRHRRPRAAGAACASWASGCATRSRSCPA